MISLYNTHSNLVGEIRESSGVDFNICLHCQTCANGCPFYEGMDYAPNKIIRLIQFGMEKEALESSTIWICVGCNTCCTACPMAIDIPAIMDALRHKAIETGAKIAEPDILNFHKEVLNTAQKYGRTHKLEIMMRYKLKKRDFFSDMGVGIQMLRKRKLDLTPSPIKDKQIIQEIFRKD